MLWSALYTDILIWMSIITRRRLLPARYVLRPGFVSNKLDPDHLLEAPSHSGTVWLHYQSDHLPNQPRRRLLPCNAELYACERRGALCGNHSHAE